MIGNIIALLALILSGYATYRTHKFKESEQELFELQKKVNKLVLSKEKKEADEATKANIGANFIKIGKAKHRLKVFNKGKATAYNVKIEFPDGNDLIIESDVEDKFPMEIVEQGQSVDLVAVSHTQSNNKLKIRLIWENDDGSKDEKIIYPTL